MEKNKKTLNTQLYCVSNLLLNDISKLPFSTLDHDNSGTRITHTDTDSSIFFTLNPNGTFSYFWKGSPFNAMKYIFSSFKGFNGESEYFGVTYYDPQNNNIKLNIIIPGTPGYFGAQEFNTIGDINIDNVGNFTVPIIKSFTSSISSPIKAGDYLRHVFILQGGSYNYIYYGTYDDIQFTKNGSVTDTSSYSGLNGYNNTNFSSFVQGAFYDGPSQGTLQKNTGFGMTFENFFYTIGDFAIATEDDPRISFPSGGLKCRWMTYVVCNKNDVFFYTLDINHNLRGTFSSSSANNDYSNIVCNWYSKNITIIPRIVYWGTNHFDFAFYDSSFLDRGYDGNQLTADPNPASKVIVFNTSPTIKWPDDFTGSWNVSVNNHFFISRFAGNGENAGGLYDRTWFFISIPSKYYGGLGNIDFCIDTTYADGTVSGPVPSVPPIRIKVAVSGFSTIASEITKIIIWDSDLNGGLRSQPKTVGGTDGVGQGFHSYIEKGSDGSPYQGPAYGGLPNSNYRKGTNFWYEVPGNFSASTTMQFINHQLCVFSGGRSYYIG